MHTRKKILVADDDRVMRELLGGILTKTGYNVIFAQDGVDAVEKASTEQPDLVLMDGLMSKMHGFLACKTIKQFSGPPKVILLTGIYTKPTWEAKSEHLADELLSKPFERDRLLASIERLLSELERERGIKSPIVAEGTPSPLENRPRDSEKGFSISAGQPADELVGSAR
ncbi:MAG: response regulator [Acidobacteriota bacterium]